MARLKELFKNEIKPNLKKEFGYKNHFMVPQIQKIILQSQIIMIIYYYNLI